MVDAAHEWGFHKFSEFEAMSEEDQAIAIAHTRTVRTMRAVEMEEQRLQALRDSNKPHHKGRR
jgi:hypothetical protein